MSSDMAVDNYTDQWRVVLCVLLLGFGTAVYADNADQKANGGSIKLSVSPLTCVALHKKQVCYKPLDFHWSSLPRGRYCLHASNLDKALQCWNHGELNKLRVNYESASEITYELRSEGREDTLASIVVKTSWVYRTGRRSASGWRLF